MQHPTHLYSPGKIIALISSLALMIVSMVPWGVAMNKAGEKVVVTGLKGDGKITIILGAIAIVCLLIKKIPIWVALILGLATTGVGIIDLLAVLKATKPVSGTVGYGLYITLFSGLGMIVGSLLELFKKRT